MTALKRAEAERLGWQINRSQRLAALGTLAGGVAHEINNALVPVIALTKMVAGKLPDGSREWRNLATVLTGAERSRDLVKQILAFSRKEEEVRRRESVDVGAVLHEALRLMRATLPTSIQIEKEIAPTPRVTGDPNQLLQCAARGRARRLGIAQQFHRGSSPIRCVPLGGRAWQNDGALNAEAPVAEWRGGGPRLWPPAA